VYWKGDASRKAANRHFWFQNRFSVLFESRFLIRNLAALGLLFHFNGGMIGKAARHL
jgi:hypothetical protein